MKSLFFLLLCLVYFSECAIIYNQTVVIFEDDLENIYAKYEEYPSNEIKNAKDFHAHPGRALISFELLNHNIYLINYKQLPDSREEKLLGAYSAMYGKTLPIGIYRAKNINSDDCMTIETCKRYRKYVELGLRLWTGNQVKLNQGDDDGYISSTCLAVEKKWWNADARGALEAQLMNEAIKADGDKARSWATRWFITDWFGGGWEGLAVVGNPSLMTNKNTNYWLFIQDNYYGIEDKDLGRLSTLMHEYTHNLGFSHSNTVDTKHSGQFYNFATVDGYYDCASYMGNCADWYHPPCMSSYRAVVVNDNKPEPWLYKVVETGKHTYRLYAMDHPYSRNFLGTSSAYHQNDEVFDGVPFKYAGIAIEIPISKKMTSKFTGGDSYAAINLEYRINEHGLNGAKTNGARFTYGVSWTSGFKNGLCNVLKADIDKVGSWEDSELPFGTIYYPWDIDTGTLTLQIKKINRAKILESLEEMIPRTDKRSFKEAPYLDIEINYNPGVKQNMPSGTVKPISMKFSPSWFNCKRKDDTYGFTCYRSTSTGSGWGYLEDEFERSSGPRIYNNLLKYYQPIYGFRSYTSKQNLLWAVCYGASGRVCPRIEIQDAKLTDFTLKVYQFASIKRTRNVENATEENYGEGLVLYGEGVSVPEGGRIYISDLFYGEQGVTVKDGKFLQILPNLETDGFAEGAVIVKDKSGTVVSYKVFTTSRNINSDRITVTKIETGYETIDNSTGTPTPVITTITSYNIGTAAIAASRFTTSSMLIKQTIQAGSWLYYPIMDLAWNDYFYVDFGNTIPSGFTMTIETDTGNYEVNLFELEGHSGVSYKLSYLDLNNKMGCLCDIYKFKFSKTIQIVNIRVAYASQTGNTIQAFANQTGSFVYDGYKYNIQTTATGAKFVFNSFSRNINGKSYSFDGISSSYSDITIAPIFSKSSSSTVIIVVVVIAVLLVLIIGCYCYMKKKKSSVVARSYNPGSRPPPIINPAFNPASRPPPIVNPGYGRTMPPPRGYGGYGGRMPPQAGVYRR